MYEDYDIRNKGVSSEGRKRGYKLYFLFDSWFSPNRLAEDMVDFVADMVGMVKTNIKGFCKDIIENTKNYWSGGSYLV